MPKKKIVKDQIEEEVAVQEPTAPTELEELRELYQEMRNRGFNSIGDIEVRISRLQ